jgi:ribulose-phosphate 3-epimerase
MRGGIAPSILSFDPSNLHEPVRAMMRSGAAACIHLDVMDGQFVPPITFGDALARSLASLGGTMLEAHLMTLSPERHFESFASAGCGRIIFHAETTHHGHRLAQSLRSMGVQSGVAINPGTHWSVVEPLLGSVDLVLVMTVNPGWGGQAFLESSLDAVREIRRRAPEVLIEVDGGIDPGTLPRAREAGADLFVVGSYLERQPNLECALRELQELCG